jgi:capsular exopolysaccharide synthesis family protein
LVVLVEPDSTATECFKMLRSRLQVISVNKPLRTIMVTSAEPFEGKSLVAGNLAVSIAKGINDYVILVDCDLRAPSLHKLFNLNPRFGLGEYLESGASLAQFLIKTPVDKLTLLPGGEPTSNAAELVGSLHMNALIQELKTRYDDRYVIFDSPPGQFAGETALLAQKMDGVIMVVRYGKTSRRLISETIENVGRDRILGVVFNFSPEREKDYRYYYRYYKKQQT